VTVAKALGNGIPIGACLTNKKASTVLTPGSHGSTFGGNFISTSVAIQVLDIMREKNLSKNARLMGLYIEKELKENLAKYSIVKDIRCRGLMIGIELKVKCLELVEEALKNRLVINVTKENTIRMLPPLIIKKSEADIIVNVICKIISEIKYE
jgi:acetylornithine aminotransferase